MNEFQDINLDELLNEPQPLFTVALSSLNEDIMNLSRRIDQLTIKVNTQNLTIELERIKRSRLRRSVNQLKSEVL